MIVKKPEILPWLRILPDAGEIVHGSKYCSKQAMLMKMNKIVN